MKASESLYKTNAVQSHGKKDMTRHMKGRLTNIVDRGVQKQWLEYPVETGCKEFPYTTM